jgi:Rad3-related DNA helicase
MSDEQKSMKGKLLQELLWSPLTWLPLIPAVGVYAFIDMPGWASLLGFGAALGLMGGLCASKWSRLKKIFAADSLQKRERERVEKQQAFLHSLQKKGLNLYAQVFERALACRSRVVDGMLSGVSSLGDTQELVMQAYEDIVAEIEKGMRLRKTLSNSSADTDGRRRMEEQVGTLDKELENAVFALEKLVANLESRVTGKRGLVGRGSRLKKLTRMLDEEDRLLQNVAKRLEDIEESESISS